MPAGTVLDGRFRILRRIGAGGVGAVFEAEEVTSGAQLALKVMHPAFAAMPEVIERFRREAAALSSVRSPFVVAVRDLGTALTPEGELPWMAMELLHGCTLADRLEGGPLAVAEAIVIAAQALQALAAVHAAGIQHRDVKPENLFLAGVSGRRGLPEASRRRVKLLDFGLSLSLAEPRPDRLTRIGFTVGTPLYMAPEQALGDAGADQRIDLFSLGVTLFEMLTGTLPFDGPSYTVVLARLLSAPPPRPRALRSDIPEALEAVVLRALEKDPAHRFADADSFRRALIACRPAVPVRATTVRAVAAGG